MVSNIIKIEISATTVAWYGAIVATMSAVIGILNYLRDRSKIKIRYKGGWKIIGQQALYDSAKTYFVITVINKGRRPIRIERAGIRMVGLEHPWFLLSDSFMPYRNKVLTEENPTTEFLVSEELIDFSKAWYIAVKDATGREYRKYFHLFPTLWRMWYFLRFRR